MVTFKPLDQIAYIPDHADGDINHEDVEFGFIVNTSCMPNMVFCRYWHNKKDCLDGLRTTANSEITPTRLIVHFESVNNKLIEDVIKKYQIDVSGA